MTLTLAPIKQTSNLNSAAAGQAALRLIQEQDLKRMLQMNEIVQITNAFSKNNSLKTSEMIVAGGKNEAEGMKSAALFSIVAGALTITGGIISLGLTAASVYKNATNVQDMASLNKPPGGVGGPGGVQLAQQGQAGAGFRTEAQIQTAIDATDKPFKVGSEVARALTDGLAKVSEGYGTQLRSDAITLKADKDAAKAATENMAQQYNTVSQQLAALAQHSTEEVYDKVRALGQYNDYRMVPA